jgi:antitoxin ParD1/3/4
MIKSYTRREECTVRSTQQFSITLPNEMAEVVRAKVASGEYATESEVIRDGLRALMGRDQAVEAWLRTEVAAAYDALKKSPGRAISAEKLRKRLAEAARKLTT